MRVRRSLLTPHRFQRLTTVGTLGAGSAQSRHSQRRISSVASCEERKRAISGRDRPSLTTWTARAHNERSESKRNELGTSDKEVDLACLQRRRSLLSIAMKPRNRQHRSLNVSSSRWMAYAVAGLATASGGAISAEGAIHYSDPANVILRGDDRATFPLNDLGDKLIFVHRVRGHLAFQVAIFYLVGSFSASLRFHAGSVLFHCSVI